MQLKLRYKMTEVGVIPDDWEVVPLGENLSSAPRYGINAAAVPFSDRLPTYIRITDITPEGRLSSEERVSVDAVGSESYFLSDGDIVFARTGASVGKSYLYRRDDGPLVFAGFLIRIRLKEQHFFMVDASKGFIKDGNKSRLRAQDIHKIVDAFTRQVEIPRFSRMVPLAEISDPKNDFNLNLPRYIDSSEPEDIQDIDAHLRGGIPNRDLDALEHYWRVFPGVRVALFKKADRSGYSQLKVAATDIKASIFGHSEFTAWSVHVTGLFVKWQATSATRLRGIAKGDKPKALIHELAENLLATFEKAPLLDAYDVYQHLMDYWAETMQDDVYQLVSEGWREAAKPQLMADGKDKKSKDKPDFVLGKQKFKTELLPPAVLIACYFAAEQSAIDELESEAASISQAMDEMVEENSGDDGLLEEVKNDKGKVTKAAVAARLKDIKNDRDAADERKLLTEYLALAEREGSMGAKAKAAQEALIEKVAVKYGKMTEDEIKTLVVAGKWLAALAADVQSELDDVSQTLTRRVRELADRYANPLPQLESGVAELAARVDAHLQRLGAVCN